MLTLFCALIGFKSPVFAVDIDIGDTIGDVKTKIQKKKMEMIKCDANELDLYLALKGGEWLTVNDIDAIELEYGDVTQDVQHLVEGNPEVPKKRIHEWLTDKNLPPFSPQQLHILVKVPVRYHPHPWRFSASIDDAMDTNISRIIYRLASDYSGNYDPELRNDTKNVLIWYKGTTLHTRSLFRQKSTALYFENDLLDETITERSPFEGLKINTQVTQVLGEPRDLHSIFTFDFKFADILFPDGIMSSLVDQTTEEFKYQRIEHEDVFGSVGLAENWCLLKKDCYQERPCYQKFDRNKSCRLALSRGMTSWYYGISFDIPVVNMSVESVSLLPVIENRFEIKLVLRAVSSHWGKLIARQLKEGAQVSDDFLEMKTSVYVEDPLSFCACMDWKHAQIADTWEKFFKLSPATE